jgi:hypothetical protein
VGENDDSYSGRSDVVLKLDCSSFRKCEFFLHESPLTPLNDWGVVAVKLEFRSRFFVIHETLLGS